MAFVDQNQKKRHHYIPITYLNGFADKGGKVFAYRKDEPLKPLHIRPTEIAFERYYYSQPLSDGGRDNNTIEGFFSTVESTWPSLVTRLRSGIESKSDFEALCIFMALMRVRVPAARDIIETSLAEQVKATALFLDKKGMLLPKSAGYEDILEHLVVAIDPHQSLHAIPSLLKGFGIVVNKLSFEVIHNKTDVSFLSSDNPVIYFDPSVNESRLLPYQVRPPHGSIELLFPIDADVILRGRTGRPSSCHALLTDRQAAKRINRLIARFGYRFVFSQDRNHGALISKFAGESPVLRTTTLPSPEGGNLLFAECVFGVRPTKPKWIPN